MWFDILKKVQAAERRPCLISPATETPEEITMAREIGILNARKVETLKSPGRHADGGNLYLSISENGGKRWVYLYRFRGKRKEMGLGSASKGNVSLLEARKEAANGA
jgi:hypothetical protein